MAGCKSALHTASLLFFSFSKGKRRREGKALLMDGGDVTLTLSQLHSKGSSVLGELYACLRGRFGAIGGSVLEYELCRAEAEVQISRL